MKKQADGKVHIDDPMGEIKQLGGEPQGKKEDSANARAAAMKEAAVKPGGIQSVEAAPPAQPAPGEAAIEAAIEAAAQQKAAKEAAAPAEAPPQAQAQAQAQASAADGSEWS
jgi:hypothetical protein